MKNLMALAARWRKKMEKMNTMESIITTKGSLLKRHINATEEATSVYVEILYASKHTSCYWDGMGHTRGVQASRPCKA